MDKDSIKNSMIEIVDISLREILENVKNDPSYLSIRDLVAFMGNVDKFLDNAELGKSNGKTVDYTVFLGAQVDEE